MIFSQRQKKSKAGKRMGNDLAYLKGGQFYSSKTSVT